MDKCFSVLSSNGATVYKVVFEMIENKLTVRCDCEAGVRGKHCKHKSNLLLGNYTDSDDYREVMGWVRQSPIHELLAKVTLSEVELDEKKRQLDRLKRSLEKVLRG